MKKNPSSVITIKHPITGTLTHAGTMTIRDEELTGVFIRCTKEALAAVEHLPMYRAVVVVGAAELEELRKDKARLDRLDSTRALADCDFYWKARGQKTTAISARAAIDAARRTEDGKG